MKGSSHLSKRISALVGIKRSKRFVKYHIAVKAAEIFLFMALCYFLRLVSSFCLTKSCHLVSTLTSLRHVQLSVNVELFEGQKSY